MSASRGGFAARLLLAQTLVILIGAVTLLFVALGLAPGLFRTHVERAVGPITPELATHLDMAFARATLISLGIATAAAMVAALAVASFITRRAVRPIEELARAAAAVSQGDYSMRVESRGLGTELTTLNDAFNTMAREIAATERTRAEMLRDLAHELRTPLTSVRGYHEAIADGVLPADRATFARVEAELSRMERLVDDVATVSRVQERRLVLDRRTVQVSDLVSGAAENIAVPAHNAGVTVQVDHTAGDAAVWVDPDRMHEVLGNLLTNALRHTPTGGTITIGTRMSSAKGTEVEISVADTGTGIAPEHLPRLFERFYRAERGRSRSDGGSGIGLAIVRGLVEAHGGRVRAESPGLGHGATFTLTMPRSAHPRPARPAPTTTTPARAGNTAKRIRNERA